MSFFGKKTEAQKSPAGDCTSVTLTGITHVPSAPELLERICCRLLFLTFSVVFNVLICLFWLFFSTKIMTKLNKFKLFLLKLTLVSKR